MPTLKQLRIGLGWSMAKLAQEAGVARQTVASAERGDIVYAQKAKAIADALGRGYGKEIIVWQIEGINVL